MPRFHLTLTMSDRMCDNGHYSANHNQDFHFLWFLDYIKKYIL
jgi:hypothetical protein